MAAHRSFEDFFKTPLFRKLEKLSDVIVVGKDGVEFKTHKLFLAKESGYFSAYFRGNFEDSNDTVKLSLDSSILKTILIFVYTGEIYIDDKNIVEMTTAADFLQIDTLLMKCRNYVLRKISVDSCITLLILSDHIVRLQTKEHCFRFVQINFGSLLHKGNSDIEELPPNIFKDLISGNSLGVPDEDTVWKTIVMWIESDPAIRLKQVPELISCIRWSEVSYSLTSTVSEHPIFKDNEFCRGIHPEELIRTSVNEIPESDKITGRIPTKIHIFAFQFKYAKSLLEPTSGITEIFLAYDDKLDYCRKIGETEYFFDFLFAVGQFIFLFNDTENTLKSFDLITKRWCDKESPTRTSIGKLVQCQNRLFYVGVLIGSPITLVQCYDPTTDIWSYCSPAPLQPDNIAKVCVLSDRIIVIGSESYSDLERNRWEHTPEMHVLVYDSADDVWSNLRTPKQFRPIFSFELINFHERLYILGGRDREGNFTNEVEVYCPERNQWDDFAALPFPYPLRKSVILEDKLTIYDDYRGCIRIPRLPPCTLNEETETWNKEDALLKKLFSPNHEIFRYLFCFVDDTRTLKELSRENRDPNIVWTKTTFELHES